MNRFYRYLLAMSVLFCAVFRFLPVFADTTDNVNVTYSAKGEPNGLISFMTLKNNSDFDNPANEDIYRVDIVTADSNGNCKYNLYLENAVIDADGNIQNYSLNSSDKTLNINSGIISHDVGELVELRFSVPPKNINGVIFVPIAETFEQLGVKMTYDSEFNTYTGSANNGNIEIIMGKDTVRIDWVDIELPSTTQNIDGVDMMPMYILEDVLKTTAPTYNQSTGTVSVIKPARQSESGDTFDISDIINTLPQGNTVVSPSAFSRGLRINSDSSEFVSIARESSSVTISTHENSFGEIPENLSGIQLPYWTNTDFPKGNVGIVSFDVCVLSSEQEDGSASIGVLYQRTSDWNKALSQQIDIPDDGEWHRYYLPVYSKFYDMNKSQSPHIMIQVGGQAKSIVIRGFTFTDYGTSVSIDELNPSSQKPYKGMDEDALWRKEAYRRIEKYRKNDIAVKVVDENGNPINGAEITADMTDSEFMFGISLCERELMNLDTSTTGGRLYDEALNKYFNAGVCGLEMKEPYIVSDDAYDGIRMTNEFLRRGKRVRGHAILWDSDNRLPVYDPDTASYNEWYKTAMDYAENVAYTFKGSLAQWDVINEPTQSNDLRTKYNSVKIQADILKKVRSVDPDVKLYINETGIEGKNNENDNDCVPSFLKIVNDIKREGAPVDGIGIQAHCTKYTYPQGFYHQLDECALVADEVAVTEYDFMNENMDYAPQHLRDMLLATFSHPKATAFMVWGLQDSMHWRNCAVFYDSSWNAKPALEMWDDMVNNEFATHAVAVTDNDGNAVIRGFRGTYNIKCSINGKEYTAPFVLKKGSDNTIVFTVSGSNISAAADDAKSVYEAVKYEDCVQAKAEFDSENESNYYTVYFDKMFRGKHGIENSAATASGSNTKASYLSGQIFGSENGIDSFVAHADSGVYLKTADASKQGDISHILSDCNVLSGSDITAQLNFDTLNATDSGNMGFDMQLIGSETYSGARVCYSNGSCSLITPDGSNFALNSDSKYTLVLELKFSNGGYTPVYNVKSPGGDVLYTHTDETTTYTPTDKIGSVKINIYSNADSVYNVFRIINISVSGQKSGEQIEYQPTQMSTVVLDDSMKNFDISSAEYMGAALGSDNALTDGNTWGLYSQNSETDAFAYRRYGHYLYAMRSEPSGDNILAKKFRSINQGDTLQISFDMYINGDAKWYNSPGKAAFSVGDSSGSKLEVTSFEYNQYKGFWLNVLGNRIDIESYTVNDWNRTNLTVTLKLYPNFSSSKYDAAVVVTNNSGFRSEYKIESVMSFYDASVLDTIYLLSRTYDSGTRYGMYICGFKNFIVSETPLESYGSDGIYTCANDEEYFEIPYNNITGHTKGATIIVGYYESNDNLIDSYVHTEDFDSGKGSLRFVVGKRDKADHIKVLLLNNVNDILPLKPVDIIRKN